MLEMLLLRSVEVVRFKAYQPLPAPQGRVLTGLALPYGVAASPQHPAFGPGVLVEYGHPKPLLLEHDITTRVGDVVRVWEEADGVHFVATLIEPVAELPSGLSVGGEYVVEGNQIKALYIYEISLTNSPAYEATNYNIIAMQTLQNKRLRAQEEEGMITPESAIESAIALLTQRVDALEERIAAIEEKLAAQDSATQEALEAAKKSVTTSATLLAQVQELVDKRTAQVLKELHAFAEQATEAIQKLYKS